MCSHKVLPYWTIEAQKMMNWMLDSVVKNTARADGIAKFIKVEGETNGKIQKETRSY